MFSEDFPELWLFAMGGLFIAVVLAFPGGLAGLVTEQILPRLPWRKRLGAAPLPAAHPAPAE
jgi:urea transport system permease protein